MVFCFAILRYTQIIQQSQWHTRPQGHKAATRHICFFRFLPCPGLAPRSDGCSQFFHQPRQETRAAEETCGGVWGELQWRGWRLWKRFRRYLWKERESNERIAWRNWWRSSSWDFGWAEAANIWSLGSNGCWISRSCRSASGHPQQISWRSAGLDSQRNPWLLSGPELKSRPWCLPSIKVDCFLFPFSPLNGSFGMPGMLR